MDTPRIVRPSRGRYDTLAISPVWRLDRLRPARALVVGCGALGNEVCKNLALMGVAQIVVVDADTIELANLTRSVFFRPADEGRFKAEVIAERIRELNSDVQTLPLVGKLDAVVGLGLLRRCGMVFSCLDNRLARQQLNRMCHKVDVKWVDGAMENLVGEVAAYVPGEGACYECTLTSVDKEIIARAVSCRHVALQNLNQGRVPTTPTMGSIVAAMQVQEAIKLLQDDERHALVGRRLVLNALSNDYYVARAERNEDCEGHGYFGEITEEASWKSGETTAREVLERLRRDTGSPGHLRLGFDLVLGVRCGKCAREESLPDPVRSPLSVEAARCSRCGEIGDPLITNKVQENDPIADWPLARLKVARFDVLEARSARGARWYELSGDADMVS